MGLNNRQNLTADEQLHAVEVFNASGRLDQVKTDAANNEIFHSRNVVLVNSSGSVVKDAAATLAKHKAAKAKFLADNK